MDLPATNDNKKPITQEVTQESWFEKSLELSGAFPSVRNASPGWNAKTNTQKARSAMREPEFGRFSVTILSLPFHRAEFQPIRLMPDCGLRGPSAHLKDGLGWRAKTAHYNCVQARWRPVQKPTKLLRTETRGNIQPFPVMGV